MKLAIVGAEEQTRHLAPWDDPDYEIWVFNEFATAEWCKRWDALLQIHTPSVYQNLYNKRNLNYWAWLQEKHGKPIYMQHVDPLVPDSVKFPLDEINEKLLTSLTWDGNRVAPYRASIAFAIALAVYQGRFEQIDIFGVELTATNEYRSQKHNFAFWVGLATGRGQRVNLRCSRATFDQSMYGYEEFMQEEKIQSYINGMEAQLVELEERTLMVKGALALARQMLDDEQKDLKPNVEKTQEDLPGHGAGGKKSASSTK